jgi:hypothetical protein
LSSFLRKFSGIVAFLFLLGAIWPKVYEGGDRSYWGEIHAMKIYEAEAEAKKLDESKMLETSGRDESALEESALEESSIMEEGEVGDEQDAGPANPTVAIEA